MKNVYLERKKDGRFTFGSLQSQDCVPDFNTQYTKKTIPVESPLS